MQSYVRGSEARREKEREREREREREKEENREKDKKQRKREKRETENFSCWYDLITHTFLHDYLRLNKDIKNENDLFGAIR